MSLELGSKAPILPPLKPVGEHPVGAAGQDQALRSSGLVILQHTRKTW